jgi:hypothetical protein
MIGAHDAFSGKALHMDESPERCNTTQMLGRDRKLPRGSGRERQTWRRSESFPDDEQTGSNRITIISWLNFPGVGTGKQNAVTLIHFASSAEIFEISASLIR